MTVATIAIVTEECCNCHVIFGVTRAFNQDRLDNGESFYCPNGHGQSYTETNLMRAQRERDEARAEQRRYARLAGERYEQVQAAERRAAAQRGQVTKMKRRIIAGTCPFGCRRNFVDLGRHVASKHPKETPDG